MWITHFILFCGVGVGVVVCRSARDFPAGFQWGAASASYQVEGAWNHSDKAESIWDRLVHTRPDLTGGDTGDVACDSHALWREDLRLIQSLGLHFYRFSISWPRLLPDAPSTRVSAAGAHYYRSLAAGLREAGVRPLATLYHWDLPQSLQDLGGWTNPLIVEWFAEYARVAFELFGEDVKTWITINEPVIMCELAYSGGELAPGLLEPRRAPHLCARHVLLAHAAAWRIYDQQFRPKQKGEVSLANHLVWFEPETEEDEEVADLAMQLCMGRYSEPIFGAGGWPAGMARLIDENSRREGNEQSRLPPFTQQEIEFIKGTFDFYGVNHYTSRTVRRGAGGPREGPGWLGWPFGEWDELPATLGARAHWPTGVNDWLKVNPEGLRKLLAAIRRQYGPVPVLITENGFPTRGGLQDADRIHYYEQYLEQILLAIREDGVNVTGFTAWTLLDNFEWMDGYRTKFGLYEVDFTSPQRTRTPRLSAQYYADVIKYNSLDVPESGQSPNDEL